MPPLCLAGAAMDLVLSAADYYFFTPYVYPATWPEDNIIRQTISLLIVTNLGAYILYFFCATLSYYFVYDHSLMKHPQFLKVRDFFSSFCYHKNNVVFVNLWVICNLTSEIKPLRGLDVFIRVNHLFPSCILTNMGILLFSVSLGSYFTWYIDENYRSYPWCVNVGCGYCVHVNILLSSFCMLTGVFIMYVFLWLSRGSKFSAWDLFLISLEQFSGTAPGICQIAPVLQGAGDTAHLRIIPQAETQRTDLVRKRKDFRREGTCCFWLVSGGACLPLSHTLESSREKF